MLPLNLPELEVSGLALVTSIDDCPPIADGEGSVVTARFVTREVHVVASVDVLGADGTVETITGTTIHPVWSVDRKEWVPLAELTDGETLQGLDGLAIVLSVTLSRVSQPVYNIEVHGEHVYQVGELGVVVHNACHFHHPWPKYLGGPSKQILVKLDDKLHIEYHRGLDKILPRQWGKKFYDSLSVEAKLNADAKLGAYTRAFDKIYGTNLWQLMVHNGFLGV
jgi:hypothetical protein